MIAWICGECYMLVFAHANDYGKDKDHSGVDVVPNDRRLSGLFKWNSQPDF